MSEYLQQEKISQEPWLQANAQWFWPSVFIPVVFLFVMLSIILMLIVRKNKTKKRKNAEAQVRSFEANQNDLMYIMVYNIKIYQFVY